jgi:PAS domain S-box-containing protein
MASSAEESRADQHGSLSCMLGSRLWQGHPDGLLLIEDERIVDANPAVEDLLGYELQSMRGGAVERFVPGASLMLSDDRRGLFAARHRDGSTFPATSSVVPLGQPENAVLLMIRDLTGLMEWRDAALFDADQRLDDVKMREAAIAAQRENLTQQLFAAGIALQLCQGSGITDVGKEHLGRAIDVLDQVMNDLLASER